MQAQTKVPVGNILGDVMRMRWGCDGNVTGMR